jgi:hypothetical protein
MLKSGLIGSAIGFATGAAVGYSYQAGWQSVLHGNDSRTINKLYKTARYSLKAGNLGIYKQASSQLIEMGIRPPSGVLAGYSPIAGDIDHTFVTVAKAGRIYARGFSYDDRVPALGSLNGFGAATGQPVGGLVRDESMATLARSSFRFLTSDLTKVDSVLNNMYSTGAGKYNLLGPNCYTWRNEVLSKSGVTPPSDLPWIN